MVTNQKHTEQLKLNSIFNQLAQKKGINNINVIDILKLKTQTDLSYNDIICSIHHAGMLHHPDYCQAYKDSL